MAKDWKQWHKHYENADPSLLQRLEAVRHDLHQALMEATPSNDGVIHLTIICAGEGLDVLPVLAELNGARQVQAVLIELDPQLAERARATASALGLSNVDVRTADAGTPETYRDIPPANVLTVCGVFGNISVEDVGRTIAYLPGLMAANGIVVWTRGVKPVDRTPEIRATFATRGFVEMSFAHTPDGIFGVGTQRLTFSAASQSTEPDARIFSFR